MTMDIKKTLLNMPFVNKNAVNSNKLYTTNSNINSIVGENQAVRSGVKQNRDRVSVSNEGMLRTNAFNVARNSSDIRQEKINAIKEKLSSGTYHIDTKQLAFNLLREEALSF